MTFCSSTDRNITSIKLQFTNLIVVYNKPCDCGGKQVPACRRKTNIHPLVLQLQDNECLLEGNVVSSQYLSVILPLNHLSLKLKGSLSFIRTSIEHTFLKKERQVQTVVIIKNRLCVCVVFKGETRRNHFLLLTPVESIVNQQFSIRYCNI